MSIDGMVKNGVAALAVSGVLLGASAGYGPAKADGFFEDLINVPVAALKAGFEIPVRVLSGVPEYGPFAALLAVPGAVNTAQRTVYGVGNVVMDMEYSPEVGEDGSWAKMIPFNE